MYENAKPISPQCAKLGIYSACYVPKRKLHTLQCKAINRNLNSDEVARGKISYLDIFEDHIKQKEVTELFSKLLNIKKTMTENSLPTIMDPSTLSDLVLKTSYNLHGCTVNYSSGK